jgi:hypothetical protein
VKLREWKPEPIATLKRRMKSHLRGSQKQPAAGSDYLGSDVLRPSANQSDDRFRVSESERTRLVSRWFGNRGKGGA